MPIIEVKAGQKIKLNDIDPNDTSKFKHKVLSLEHSIFLNLSSLNFKILPILVMLCDDNGDDTDSIFSIA